MFELKETTDDNVEEEEEVRLRLKMQPPKRKTRTKRQEQLGDNAIIWYSHYFIPAAHELHLVLFISDFYDAKTLIEKELHMASHELVH